MTGDSRAKHDPRDGTDPGAGAAAPRGGAGAGDQPGSQSEADPKAGVKAGAKRRRTASLKVSRSSPGAADGERGDTKAGRGGKAKRAGRDQAAAPEPGGPPPGPFDKPWVNRLRAFLNSTPGKVLLAVSAAVALPLGPLAIYSVFALVFLFRVRLRRAVARLPFGPRLTLGLFIVLAGMVREVLTWTAEYIQGDDWVLLWHPQLVPNLLFNLGIFVAWAVGWALALRWFRYHLVEVLFIQAIYGLAIENFGAFLMEGLRTAPGGLILLVYAVTLSACTMGIAWILAQDKLATLPGQGSDSGFRYAAPPLLISVAVVVILMVWVRVLDAFDVFQARAPIRERPFW